MAVGAVIAAGTLHASETSLRDLEADRPDATESPRTVDAGYFQIDVCNMYTHSQSKPCSLGMIKAVCQIGRINIQVQTAVNSRTHGNGYIVEIKAKICGSVCIVMLAKVIEPQRPSFAEIKIRTENGAHFIVIQIEVIEINLDIGTPVPD